ncbi:MAG: HlyD family secretion protein [Flavobacteriales bacterium]
MKIKTVILIALLFLTLISCKKGDEKADGYGNFEATETTISSETNGKLLQFTVEKGQKLKKGQVVGLVDTLQLYLKKQQLRASKNTIGSKSRGVLSQINVLQAQLATAKTNKTRIENLIKANAGTQKQLDDVNGQIDVIQQQIRSVETQNAPIVNEIKNVDVQIKQIEDQIQKGILTNPISGTVLSTYAEPNEVVAFGKPLYKIADLSTMELRVYVSEPQLPSLKIGQQVTVKIDSGDSMKSFPGTITWISSEAEFTPKIIQTKEERVNLVYAVKITLNNDGSLKIGMPAEMWIQETEN